MPTVTPAATARGNEVNDAQTATTSTRVISDGPGLAVRNGRDVAASCSVVTMPAKAPVSVQTTVETVPGLIPARRARSGCAADARMARPHAEYRSQAASVIMADSEMTKSATSPPSILMPNHSNSRAHGVGKSCRLWSADGSGRANSRASANCARPIVATRRMTLGAVKSRRTTVSSARPRNAAPAATAIANPSQYGRP